MPPDDLRPRLVVHLQRSSTALRTPGLAAWLAATAPVSVRGEVTVALLPDARVRALNRRFRHKDYVTDVLSFPTDGGPADRLRQGYGGPPTLHAKAEAGPHVRGLPPDRRSRRRNLIPDTRNLYLGDIVIAVGQAGRQAREAGHSVSTEVRILALHGLLHLAGYDHERASDRGRMERVERRLRARGGLPEGLIERGGRR